MKTIIAWINSALATKDLGAGMTYYRVDDGEIRATDGRITAGHPWLFGGEFLVAGVEFEKIIKRMKNTPSIVMGENNIKLKDGRLHGTIQTLPLTTWDYTGVGDVTWQPIPKQFLELLKTLKPFVSDNSTQVWATCIAVQDGWLFATNNVAVAGAPCDGLGTAKMLLPLWTIDFLLGRVDGLVEWTWTDNYVAFRWESGAWMRSQLIVGTFNERAAAMVVDVQKETPTQIIDDDFREAFETIAELADDTVAIYADRIESRSGKSEVVAETQNEVPKGGVSIWAARFILPALANATSWSPSMWPKPAPFKGDLIFGLVVGRKQ